MKTLGITPENADRRQSIRILDGVPVPHRAERKTYPFSALQIGQCFMVDCVDMKQERSVRSSATRWNKNEDGRRYIVRRIPNQDRTVGVWRIS